MDSIWPQKISLEIWARGWRIWCMTLRTWTCACEGTMWRLLFKLCLLWVDCRSITIATYSHNSWLSAAVGKGTERVCANFIVGVLEGLYCWWWLLLLSTVNNNEFTSRCEGIRGKPLFCSLKLTGTPQAGLGAKCLSVLVLAHHCRALILLFYVKKARKKFAPSICDMFCLLNVLFCSSVLPFFFVYVRFLIHCGSALRA